MDDLNNNGYNSENGTPFEPPLGEQGVNTRYVPEFDQHGADSQKQYSESPARQMNSPQQPYYGSGQQNNYNSGFQNNNGSQNSGYNPYGNVRQYDNYQSDNKSFQNNNYGYQNGYNGGYPQNYQPVYNNGYGAVRQNTAKNSGLAIASFIIAVVNLVVFRTLLSVIAVPLSIVFAIISLAKKRTGTGFAIAGIVISVISAVIIGSAIAVFVRLYPDAKYFVQNEETIVQEYMENGTIPEYYEKYNAPKYNKYWKAMGCKDFNEFFGMIIESYANENTDRKYDYYDDDEYDYDYDEKDSDLGITDLVFT